MANNTNCPTILARLILKNEQDQDDFLCGVGAVGYICPNGTNPDGGMDPAVWTMLTEERAELEAEWLELTGNKWTWNDEEAAWNEWLFRREQKAAERRKARHDAWKESQRMGCKTQNW